MELTIEQALKQGVAAHKEGKLQEAERLYRVILQSEPSHPDANHNLGVLAVSVNKADAALPLFKTALEANPKIEQFWLSYIDALVKEKQFKNAKQALEQCNKVGLCGEKLDTLEKQINTVLSDLESNPSNQNELSPAIELRETGKYKEAQEWLNEFIEIHPNEPEALSLLSQVLLLDKKVAESEQVLLTAASLNSELPSIYRNQARLLLKQSKFAEALEKGQSGYERSSNDPENWVVLATCLRANQRDQEALDLTEKVLQSNPNYAEAHATRALIRLRSNDIIGAIADADRAVLLKPHLTQIWVLLGSMHHKNKNLAEAIKAMEKAHELEPTDANYMSDLGEFFRQDSRISEAISILEKATKLAPKNISVLINLGTAFQQNEDIDKAKAAYEKALAINPKLAEISNNLGSIAQDAGDFVSALQYFENALEVKPDVAEAHSNLGITLKELGRLEESEASLRQAISLKPDYAEAHYNLGITLQELGRLEESETSYRQAIALKPDFSKAHYNLGITLQELGKLEAAIKAYNNALSIKPDFPDAYFNRGNALKELGRLDEAVQNYDKAIQLKPDFAMAYSNRGNALNHLGRLDEAVQNYDKAIQLKPDSAEAHFNQGVALQELGRLQLAMMSYQKAVSIDPHNGLFWAGYASSLQGVKFESYNDELGNYLLQALDQPTVRPVDVSVAVIKALHYHPVISRTLALSKSEHFNEDIDHLTEQLSTVPLLLRVMELSSIADLEVEKMLTKVRQAMLHEAARGSGEALGIPFSAALAMHCFTNEYVFFESEEEKERIELLQENVKVILENEGTVSPAWIAVLGAYRPLNSFPWANALLKPEWSDEIKKVIVGQVDNVREEQALRSKIPRLSSIDDNVSQLVRNQYEENPYPRWINTRLSDKPKTISQVLQSVKLHLNFEAQQFSNNPDILVAGCGTGQHALGTASNFLNCNVLAMDLSLASLSYAIRRTQELGIKNIEYMQGDILKLDQLEREFDIIECAGVLHHMDDPLAGWKVLVGKLRTGGVMKIGLYSEIARQHIVEARREIAKKEYTSSPDDIRRYREEVIKLGPDSDPKIIKILSSFDFYSLSTCRDLLFHVQEHRFTLPQIEEALSDLGLKFLGFGLEQSWIRNEFSELYPEKDALVSLPLWHQFELKNPATFRGMYQFWVQKA